MLGLLEATWASGKGGQGDREQPGVTMHYDFLAFTQAQQPISVRSVRRTHHDTDTDVALPERDETITTLEYSDGFGRLLQTRTQAEDDILGDATFGVLGVTTKFGF